MSTSVQPTDETKTSAWQQWLCHPESLWVHRIVFQIHLWAGMLAGLYVSVMSLSGSIIIFRNQLEGARNPESGVVRVVEWFVDLHSNLQFGMAGLAVNGVGAVCLTLLCLTGVIIWWPGIAHWRRSLTVNWKSSFARVNWDLHNTLGVWCLLFVSLWGISGIYFAFPQPFNGVVDFFQLASAGGKLRLGDLALQWMSNLHFGRFNLFTEAVWAVLGLVPAALSFTGIFMCCHRLFVRKGAPLPR